MHPAKEGCAAAACTAYVRMWGITIHFGCSQHQWNSCHPAYVSMVLQEAVRQAQGAAGQWGACTSADGDPEVGLTLRICCIVQRFALGFLTTSALLAQVPKLPTTLGQPHLSGLCINHHCPCLCWAGTNVGLHVTDCCGLLCRCMLPALAHCPLGRACSVGWPLQSTGMVC